MKQTSGIAYTDGSSLGNPGPGGWGVVLLLPDGSVIEMGDREQRTTNNRMELMAIIRVLEYVQDKKLNLEIRTDSQYVINGVTSWMPKWKRNGWMTADKREVLNRDLWEQLDTLTTEMGDKVSWKKVPAHSGVAGNERADTIASSLAAKEEVDLYNGKYDVYQVDIHDTRATQVTRKSKSSKVGWYISLVDDIIMRHDTWDECKDRVMGTAGAKWKKVKNHDEEKTAVKGWGVT